MENQEQQMDQHLEHLEQQMESQCCYPGTKKMEQQMEHQELEPGKEPVEGKPGKRLARQELEKHQELQEPERERQGHLGPGRELQEHLVRFVEHLGRLGPQRLEVEHLESPGSEKPVEPVEPEKHLHLEHHLEHHLGRQEQYPELESPPKMSVKWLERSEEQSRRW